MSSDLTFITNEPGKINELVYALYVLTPEEIKLVEEAGK
jgi:hypothetical protein